MHIRIDKARCCGAGHCALLAPTVFSQDEDDGTVILLRAEVPSGALLTQIREAIDLCPTSAIDVVAETKPEDRAPGNAL